MEKQLIKRRTPIQIGVNSDPLQPMEKSHRVTLRTLKLLRDREYPTVITTKFPNRLTEPEYFRILDALPLVVQCSISSEDPAMVKSLEPGVPSPEERLEALRALSDAGVHVQLRLAPYAPDISGNMERLLNQAGSVGVKIIQCGPLKVYHRQGRQQLNKALGYDYLGTSSLRYENCGVFSSVSLEEQKTYMRPLEELCRELGLDLLSCDDVTRHRNWRCCCGVGGLPGFERVVKSAYFMNGWRISQHTDFETYMQGHNCPWHAEFEQEWNKGKLERALPELIFNKEDKTYSRMW